MISEKDIRADHPVDWGKNLVGSAKIAANTVQWIGAVSPNNLDLYINNSVVFGITGPISGYIGEPVGSNQWAFDGYLYTIGHPLPSGVSPGMGVFVAPDRAGAAQGEILCVAVDNGFSVEKRINLHGEGVADNEAVPALTLELSSQGATNKGGKFEVAAGGGAVVFSVTPRFDASRLPVGVSPVEHVLVELLVQEKDTDCGVLSQSFREQGLTPNNLALPTYLQYLSKYGVKSIGGCVRHYGFLMSVNKTLQVQGISQRDTRGGYVEYTFYVRGHLDLNNRQRWAGSHQSVQVTAAAGAAAQPQPEWPRLGFASYLSSGGQVQEARTVDVYGGVQAEGGGILPAHGTFKHMSQVIIGAKMEVHPTHRGQQAERLIVMAYKAAANSPQQLSYQRPDGSFLPWDGQVPHIGVKGVETLGEYVQFSMLNGQFTQPAGMYAFYIGYRLADGSLVFNGSAPVVFNVSP